MKLSLIQLNANNISDFEKTADHILALTRQCCESDTDLILLPECAFPGYFLGLIETDAWIGRLQTLKKELAELAKAHQKYIAIGLADRENGQLFNRLLVYNRRGQIICRYDKSNLWHFDSNWFTAGTDFPVFDTEFGRIGCMICADGRIPEIARILALKGAQLILDPVNLVAAAATPSQLNNPQYAYLLRERARENGVFLAVCDKCGMEDDSVTMLGRSMVISPEGEILAECGPKREEILTCQIDLAITKAIQKKRLAGRTPASYAILCEPTDTLPITSQLQESYPLASLECYTGIVRFAFDGSTDYQDKALSAARLCEKANARLVILPYAKGFDLSPALERLASMLPEELAVLTGYGEKQAAILYKKQILPAENPSQDQRTYELFPGIRCCFTFDEEPNTPENLRLAMLQGADLGIWFDGTTHPSFLPLLQTRSSENKMFLARVTPSSKDHSLICNPDGAVLTTSFSCENQIVFAHLNAAMSKCKTVVPGTDVVCTRIPEAYTRLLS